MTWTKLGYDVARSRDQFWWLSFGIETVWSKMLADLRCLVQIWWLVTHITTILTRLCIRVKNYNALDITIYSSSGFKVICKRNWRDCLRSFNLNYTLHVPCESDITLRRRIKYVGVNLHNPLDIKQLFIFWL